MKKLFLISVLLFTVLLKTVYAETVSPFSSPENNLDSIVNFILQADMAVYVNGYTFTSKKIADALVKEKMEGTDVILLVENKPVGGLPEAERNMLCYMESNGIKIKLYSGKLSYLHAKYIIRDNSSLLVSTDNFGENRNRGWGVSIDGLKDKSIIKTFFNDLKTSDGLPCGKDSGLIYSQPENNFMAEKYTNQKVKIFTAPDGAVENILSLLDSANKSIFVEQFYIYRYWNGKKPNTFLEKLVEKAKEGVDVKVILDSSDYNIDKKNKLSNYYTAEYINNLSRENISIQAELIDLVKTGYDKLHAKGVIVDNKTILVSSVNWNENSPTKNREIGAIVTGDVAGYFTGLFLKDWTGSNPNGNEENSITGNLLKNYNKEVVGMILFVFALSGVLYVARKIKG